MLPENKKILILAILVLVILTLWYYLQPTAKIKDLALSNISDQRVTVSWTTDKPSQGTILISKTNQFNPLILSYKNLYKDDGENYLPNQKFYLTHSLSLDNLMPQTRYFFAIYQGRIKAYQGSFVTAPTLANLTSPNPVYGKVLSPKKIPVVGALVYFQATTGASSSAQLQTLTNIQGRWSLDLANLRGQDLKNPYILTKDTIEKITVNAPPIGQFSAQTTQDKDQPWPDIILETKK